MLICRGTHQFVPVIKNLGHQIPGRPGVKTEPVLLPQTGSTTQASVRLDKGHLVTIPGQQASGGNAADSTADNDN